MTRKKIYSKKRYFDICRIGEAAFCVPYLFGIQSKILTLIKAEQSDFVLHFLTKLNTFGFLIKTKTIS